MDNKITKKDIVKHIALNTEISQAKAQQILNVLLNFIIENTVNEKLVSINKFGTFKMRKQTRPCRYSFKKRSMDNSRFTCKYIFFKNSNTLKSFLSK